MNDWREDGEAFHAFQLLQQEREEWERDQQAQREYQQYLDHKAVKDSAIGEHHEQKQSD